MVAFYIITVFRVSAFDPSVDVYKRGKSPSPFSGRWL
jgi:hypothetical protein